MIDAEAQPITSDMAPLDVDVTPLFSDGQIDASLDESLSQEEALIVEEAKEVMEPEVSEGDEEWPSLGLDVEVKEEVVDDKVEKEVKDPELIKVKEEWPSIQSIPGLELSQSQLNPESSKQKSPSSPVIEDASETSSLGELRFQDE